MQSLRRLVLRQPGFAWLMLALALAMRFAVPAGFMPTAVDGHVVIAICTGSGPMQMTMAVPGKPDDRHGGRGEQPCAFAAMAAPMLGAADAVLLAAAIRFVMVAGTRPIVSILAAPPAHLRPPLRGPPASA